MLSESNGVWVTATGCLRKSGTDAREAFPAGSGRKSAASGAANQRSRRDAVTRHGSERRPRDLLSPGLSHRLPKPLKGVVGPPGLEPGTKGL